MAQLVVSAAAAAVGFMVGGPTGAQIGWTLGAMLSSGMGPGQEGPRLSDLKVQGTEYGQPIPWVAGSPRIAGQIVWASALKEHANTESAGKGGGPEVTTYTYSVDLLILLTENEIAGISRVWKNGELVWNGTTTKDGVWGGITVYTGAADQLPDPIYEAAVGTGNAPAYRGRGYVVIQDLQLGGSKYIPNLTFEVGTALAVDYSVVQYLYNPTGTNPSWVDASIHARPVIGYVSSSGDTYASGDGILRLGGDLSGYCRICNAGDLSDFNGDYTVEWDMNIPYGAFWYSAYNNRQVFNFQGISNAPTFGFNLQPRFVSGATWSGSIKIGTGLEAINLSEAQVPISLAAGSAIYDTWVSCTMRMRSGVFQLWIGSTKIYEKDYTGTAYWDAANGRFVNPINLHSNWHYLGNYGRGGILYVKNFRFATADMYPSQTTGPYIKDLPLANYYTSVGVHEQVPEDLDATLDRVMLRSGYLSSQYNITATSTITKQVRALAMSQVASTRSALELLQQAFFFECSASDKIYIRPRATTSLVTIPFADLGCSDNAVSDVEPLALKMANDLEMPAQIALSYPNMAGDYNTDTQFSDRLLSGQESTSQMQMALGMLPAEAKGVVDALLFNAVAGRVSTTVSVGLKYARLEPGDVFNAVNFDGRTYRLRIQTKRDLGIRLELDCVLDDVGALDSAAITDMGYISTADVVQVANTLWDALDIPLLRDADDGPGYYVAVTPAYMNATDEWPGAVVARAWNSTDYEQLYTTPDACVMGTCGSTLGNWTGGNVFDEMNTLTVTVRGQLASSTRDAMLADLTVNALLVGTEVIRFRLAALVSSNTATGENTYTLSGLLRGQRGTEWSMAGHGSGEACILLNSNLRHVASQTSQIGLSRNVKAVTAGKLMSSATPEVFTDTGVALKPFAPVNLVGLRDPATGDVVLSWRRRTRLSHRLLMAGIQPVLGESVESYDVEIWDAAYTTLKRTFSGVSSPTATYNAAQQTADFGSLQSVVRVRVYQRSATVGRGYKLQGVV